MPDVHGENLGYLCRRVAHNNPEAIAYIEFGGPEPRQRTFGELEDRMNRVAAVLSSVDFRPGDRIAIGIGTRIEYVEACFGAMRAGLVPVPLNTRLGPNALDHIVRDANCKGVILEPLCTPHLIDVFERHEARIKMALDQAPPGWMHFEAELSRVTSIPETPALKGGAPAMQPYTSGSTGLPKGVVLGHEGQLWSVSNFARQFPEIFHRHTRALVAVPLFHKNAMAGAIKPSLLTGNCVVLMRQFEPRTFINALSEYKCTYSTGVPAMYSLLLQERELIRTMSFESLEYLIIGSAPCPPALMKEVEKTFKVRMLQGYGLTEGGPIVFMQSVKDAAHPIESCGKLLSGIDAKLVDETGGEHRTVGELWVRNPGIALEYHGLPQVTDERIKGGWLATRDLFRRDADGYFYFLGRTDDLMISGGENVYPAEVEKILMQHPEVLNVCVVSLPSKIKGEVPGAVIVLEKSSKETEETLKAFFLGVGPAHAHPRHIVTVESMPLAGSGKVDKVNVRDILMKKAGLSDD